MPKVNYLELQLYSRLEINPKIAEDILRFICDYADGSMQPEKFGLTEPLKEKFDKNNLTLPIKWLSGGSGSVLFKRVNSVCYGFFIDDLRPSPYPIFVDGKPLIHPERPQPKILTKVVFWIALSHIKKKPKNFIELFFKQFFIRLNCEFGFLTLKQDYDNKNHLVEQLDVDTTREVYVGQDLEKDGIPGLYWINIFGKSYVEWFSKEKFDKLECWKKEKLEDGSILLQFCEKPEECLSEVVLKQQEDAKKILGVDAFFDIKKLNKKIKIPKFLKLKDDKN